MGSAITSLGVIGSANVDCVVATVTLPRAGETVLGGDLQHLVGGKGANQAAAAARLGVLSTFIGCVGDDPDGDRSIAALVAAGVVVDHVRRSARPTGTALVVVSADGNNVIVVSPGANQDVDVTDVPLEGFDGLLLQLETPMALVEEALARNDHVVVNASPARGDDMASLVRCSAVIVNEVEARTIPTSSIDRCVVTRGARGASLLRRGDLVCDVSAPVVEVVDTVGAGDAFAAAFATRLFSGDDDVDALRYSVVAGTIATLGRGARGSLPTDDEVREWLQRGW